MSDTEQAVPRVLCGICLSELGNPSKSSFAGAQVHSDCFARRGSRHRPWKTTRGITRAMKRAYRAISLSAEASGTPISLRGFARTTPEGRAWLKRKKAS